MKKGSRKKLRKGIRIELKFNCSVSSPEHAVRGEQVRRLKMKKAKKHFSKIKWPSFLKPKLLVTFITEIFKTVF